MLRSNESTYIPAGHKHRLARLVPMSMITNDDDTLTVQLDDTHVRHLQAASFSDYIHSSEPMDLGDDWDVGTEDIVGMPYSEIDAGYWGGDVSLDEIHYIDLGDEYKIISPVVRAPVKRIRSIPATSWTW